MFAELQIGQGCGFGAPRTQDVRLEVLEIFCRL